MCHTRTCTDFVLQRANSDSSCFSVLVEVCMYLPFLSRNRCEATQTLLKPFQLLNQQVWSGHHESSVNKHTDCGP